MSEVTRSSRAVSDATVARVAAARRSLPNGWWGMLLLICAETTLFATLIASYVYLRLQTSTWPPAGIDAPSVTAPLVLTAALVATTAPMLLAARAARAGRSARARWLIVAATLVQAAYLAVQIGRFLDELSSVDPRETSYGSVYVALLGAHHAHVVVGLLLSAGVLIRLHGGLTNYRVIGVRALALYWCFVNAMAILVVLTQLSPVLL